MNEVNINLDGSCQIKAEKAITVRESECVRYRYLAHVAEGLTCAITVCGPLYRGLVRCFCRFIRKMKNLMRMNGIMVLRKSAILRI